MLNIEIEIDKRLDLEIFVVEGHRLDKTRGYTWIHSDEALATWRIFMRLDFRFYVD